MFHILHYIYDRLVPQRSDPVILQLLTRVVPHMDQMDRLLPYLAELGALHQQHGVSRQHLDLLGLAFCAAIRGVVQGGGVRGGHLHETTKAWITLIMAVCAGMKLGYTTSQDQQAEQEEFEEEEESTRWKKSVRTSCRLVEKRQAVTYEQQVDRAEQNDNKERQTILFLDRQHPRGESRTETEETEN